MKIDAVIGNPPYQCIYMDQHKHYVEYLYHKFVETSINVAEQFVQFLIPSNWIQGGKCFDTFRDMMIQKHHIVELHTFEKDLNILQDIECELCYFLWNNDIHEKCKVINHPDNTQEIRDISEGECFIAQNIAEQIIRKLSDTNYKSRVSEIIQENNPYKLASNVFTEPNYYGLPFMQEEEFEGCVQVLGAEENKKKTEYVQVDYPFTNYRESLDKYKIFIPKTVQRENSSGYISLELIDGDPMDICTETYLMAGPFNTELEFLQAYTYLNTKIVRFLIAYTFKGTRLNKDKFNKVPLVKFNQIYDDEKLMNMFDLQEVEMQYINRTFINT